MIISHELKFIFIHVHRTGGSSLINQLKDQAGSQVEILSQHGNARTPEGALLSTYKDYYKFGLVRNPWDRLLSWYSLLYKWDKKSIGEERQRFENFLQTQFDTEQEIDPYFHCNQLDYFTDVDNVLRVDMIGRYENYDLEIKKILKKIDLSLKNVPRMNGTASRDYRAYYTNKSRDWVSNRCKQDIEYFEYQF